MTITDESRGRDALAVRRGCEADAGRVWDLARGLHANGSPGPGLGFLVDLWPAHQYAEFLRTGAQLYLAESQSELFGFLLVFDAAHWRVVRPTWESDVIWYEPTQCHSHFWFIDQIAVRRCAARRGVGRALYGHLAATQPTMPAYAEVLSEPTPNTASLMFHQSVGFHAVGSRVDSDQVRTVVARGA